MDKRSQNHHADEIDEHNQPTEPLPPLDLPPYAPTSPSPYQNTQAASPYPIQESITLPAPPPNAGVYPYLPPGLTEKQVPPSKGAGPAAPAKASRTLQRSPIPILLGLGFVCVQLLLLARFCLKLFNVSVVTSSWVDTIYNLSDILVQPFHALLLQATSAIPINVEISTLLAVLVYGLCSRLLVRTLKFFMNAR